MRKLCHVDSLLYQCMYRRSFFTFRFFEARNKCYLVKKKFDDLYCMRIPSKDFTLSLHCVSYFLSIHKAEFFNPLAGARMRNPFSEKVG